MRGLGAGIWLAAATCLGLCVFQGAGCAVTQPTQIEPSPGADGEAGVEAVVDSTGSSSDSSAEGSAGAAETGVTASGLGLARDPTPPFQGSHKIVRGPHGLVAVETTAVELLPGEPAPVVGPPAPKGGHARAKDSSDEPVKGPIPIQGVEVELPEPK